MTRKGRIVVDELIVEQSNLNNQRDQRILMDGFENHPFIFSNLNSFKNRLPNGNPGMVIGGCVSPSPNPAYRTQPVDPTAGSGR